jgi:hypothetical protein
MYVSGVYAKYRANGYTDTRAAQVLKAANASTLVAKP